MSSHSEANPLRKDVVVIRNSLKKVTIRLLFKAFTAVLSDILLTEIRKQTEVTKLFTEKTKSEKSLKGRKQFERKQTRKKFIEIMEARKRLYKAGPRDNPTLTDRVKANKNKRKDARMDKFAATRKIE